MGRLDAIRFEEEIVDVAGATIGRTAGNKRIAGRITRCGQPAAGLRVEATGILTIGIETDFKPCLKGNSTRRLGTATVAADGTYSIGYAPSPPDVGFCAYSARVRIDVFDGTVAVWRSPEQAEVASVRIDRELFPGCAAGESVVIVIDASGRTVAGAEVFHDGDLVGRTDTQGALVVDGLASGDRLVARRLLNEHGTYRDGHGEGSTNDWSHRSYSTSLRVLHGGNGDNVELRQFVVSDPTAVQRLQLSSLNTLIGFNLLVSIEWDATAEEIRRYTDRLLEMSELLYNATDGQFVVERLAVFDNRRWWDDADIRIYANLNQHSQAALGDIFSGGGFIHMNPNDSHEPSVTLHELGHYGFNVNDEYKAGSGWEESDGLPQCTWASQADGTDFSAGSSKDSCLMRGARNAERKKMCSTHQANPHATTTRQGMKDCWTEIVERYGDPGWRLRTPVSRGVILDLFPNSGVPLATSTTPPSGVGVVRSYIPVKRWKPIRHTSSVVRAGECPNRLLRVEFNGSPVDDVKVWLESGSVTTYQGVTNEYTLAYGLANGPGELRLRGAHVGDRAAAHIWLDGPGIFPDLLHGSVEVDDCGPAALVLTLTRLALPFIFRLDPVGPGEARVELDVADRANRSGLARIQIEGAEPIEIAVPAAERGSNAAVSGRLSGLPESGATDVAIELADDEGRPIVIRRRSTFASVHEDDDLTIASADGRLEIFLPGGAAEPPAALMVESAIGRPRPPDGFAFVGDAYRVASSRGTQLTTEASVVIHLDVDADGKSRTGRAVERPIMVRMTDDGDAWDRVKATQRSDRFVGGTTDRLGTFALIANAELRTEEMST